MRVALYARVSKALEQNPENQLIALREWSKKAGVEIEGEYVDEVSSKDTRPRKEEVLKKLRLGEIDGVAVWKLDRWGRNLSELILELEEFNKNGKSLFSIQEGIDLSTSMGRFMANILALLANFERDIIHERTMLGLKRAKAQGKIGGRHPVNCGCGIRLENGKVHNGDIKPIRDECNKFVRWSNQTPSSDTLIKPESKPTVA
jgi:DNA invertase Pin-like site-specific DNA recombinase